MGFRKTQTKIPMILLRTMLKELDIETKENDQDRTHKIGDRIKKDGKPGVIIVKFTRCTGRNKTYSNKMKLKGIKFLMTESLTSRRYNFLKGAQEKYGVKNVRTSDGHIKGRIKVPLLEKNLLGFYGNLFDFYFSLNWGFLSTRLGTGSRKSRECCFLLVFNFKFYCGLFSSILAHCKC